MSQYYYFPVNCFFYPIFNSVLSFWIQTFSRFFIFVWYDAWVVRYGLIILYWYLQSCFYFFILHREAFENSGEAPHKHLINLFTVPFFWQGQYNHIIFGFYVKRLFSVWVYRVECFHWYLNLLYSLNSFVKDSLLTMYLCKYIFFTASVLSLCSIYYVTSLSYCLYIKRKTA